MKSQYNNPFGAFLDILTLIILLSILPALIIYLKTAAQPLCKPWQDQLSKLQQQYNLLKQKYNQLQQELSYWKGLASSLNKTISEKDKLIANLHKQLEEKNQTIENLTNELEYYKEKKYVKEINYKITNIYQNIYNIYNIIYKIYLVLAINIALGIYIIMKLFNLDIRIWIKIKTIVIKFKNKFITSKNKK